MNQKYPNLAIFEFFAKFHAITFNKNAKHLLLGACNLSLNKFLSDKPLKNKVSAQNLGESCKDSFFVE